MELTESLIAKVEAYTPSSELIDEIIDTPILFVVGITGAGKDTIQQQLLDTYPGRYKYIVSHTTRAPRENNGLTERDGEDYHFVSFQTIDAMLDERKFVEAKVVHFDNIYGTSVAEIRAAKEQGKIGITDIEIKGVREYVNLGMNIKPVFLMPPSYDTWMERLKSRYDGHIDLPDLQKRMQTALVEIEHAMQQDYFYIVINDDLQKTVDLVNRIAHGEEVDPHYQKAMNIAEEFLNAIRTSLALM